jgi:hypothetical protein
MQHRNALAVVAILLALVAAGCGAATGSESPSALPTPSATQAGFEPTQRDEGGEVTVEVTWNGPVAGAVFDVTLDTHSVDLDPLDLTDAVLTNDRGETLGAKPWGAPKGGHHREGRLAFDGDASTFLADTSFIELRISGVGAVPERVLRWEMPA